ncbi:MAG: conjugal transfer protein TraG N-terminal domain-containing protein [Pseudomonadota bacterium]
MGVSSYFEFVSTLLGWIIYENIYNVLSSSGLLFVPFLVIIISHVIATRKAGDDEGAAAVQSVKRIETDIIVTFFVILVCVIPVSTVSLSEMRYVKPALNCKLEPLELNGGETNTTADLTLDTIGDETGSAPVWWAIMHMLSKSVTAASIAGIPCSYDLASVEITLANDKIENPAVRRELQQFVNDCYAPAYAQFLSGGAGGIDDDNQSNVKWLGSELLVSTHYPNFYSSKARADFPFDSARDAGFEGDSATGGHPLCNEWWGAAQGLRSKLLLSMEQDTLNDMIYDDDSLVNIAAGRSIEQQERENIVLRKYLDLQMSNRSVTSSGNYIVNYDSTFVGDALKVQTSDHNALMKGILGTYNGVTEFGKETLALAAGAIGVVTQGPGHVAGGKVLRETVAFAQGLLLLMFVSLLPFLLLFSMFRLQYILTLTVIYFALHFVSFIWGLAYWLDNNLVSMLLHGEGLVGIYTATMNATQVGTMIWLQRFLYIVMPLTWVTMLGWVGFSAGRLMQDVNSVSQAGSAVTQAGADKAVNVATTIATKKVS